MIDLSHLPNTNRIKTDVLYANSTVGGVAWYAWQKPRGINYIYMIAAAGGGGGAAGAVGANGALGGGGGGAPNSLRNIFLASALPDILYFSVGYGGPGGRTSAAAGTAGIATYGAIYPATGTASILFALTGGNGGTTGTGASNVVATALSSMPLLGNSFPGSGQTGNNQGRGGTNPAGTLDIIAANGDKSTNPGTGGGTLPASSFATGASYIATNGTFDQVFPSHLGGQFSEADGRNGIQVPGLFYFYGGTGGASGTASTISSSGRKGGDGAYGCGGGGGGAAFTGSTVGFGGDGGPGYVIIICW